MSWPLLCGRPNRPNNGFARPSVRLSVCPSVPYGIITRKQKETKNGVNVPGDRNKRGAKFQLKRSKVTISVNRGFHPMQSTQRTQGTQRPLPSLRVGRCGSCVRCACCVLFLLLLRFLRRLLPCVCCVYFVSCIGWKPRFMVVWCSGRPHIMSALGRHHRLLFLST